MVAFSRKIHDLRYRLTHREERRTYQRQYRLDHLEEVNRKNKKHVAKYTKESAQQLKLRVLTYYSGGDLRCLRCGITDLDVLSIDHINGNGKSHREVIGYGSNLYWWLEKNGYPTGYQTLCFNCNIKKYIRGV